VKQFGRLSPNGQELGRVLADASVANVTFALVNVFDDDRVALGWDERSLAKEAVAAAAPSSGEPQAELQFILLIR
jgi:hypothetical protein